MTKVKNKQSSNLFTQALGVAKKLSTEFKKTQAVATTAQVEQMKPTQIIEGEVRSRSIFEAENYENPQHMLSRQLPKLSAQLLGRHNAKVTQVISFIAPDFVEKTSDYIFQWLNEFGSRQALKEKILAEAGVNDIVELIQNTERAQRLSQAFIEQNKLWAVLQGSVTGAAIGWGVVIDVPASILLALKTIYQIGRSHGFSLNDEADQEIVEFIFKEANVAILAEKQALLLGIKTLQSMFETQDIQHLQYLLGSNNDFELMKKWLLNHDGQFKWAWLNHLPQTDMVGKVFTPILGAALGGIYSWQFIDDVGQKAQSIFGAIRFYLNEHPNEQLSLLEAYHCAVLLSNQEHKIYLEEKRESSTKVDYEQVATVIDNQSESAIDIDKV